MKLIILLIFFLTGLPLSWASQIEKENQEETLPQISSKTLSSEKAVWGIGEEQLDELFNYSSDLVCLADTQYFYRVNTVWEEVLGWNEDELFSQPFVNLVHPQDVVPTKKVAHQATQNSTIHTPRVSLDVSKDRSFKIPMLIDFENRYRNKQGEYCLLQWLVLSQVSGPATHHPILAVGKNITLQKKAAEQKLALEQAQAATKMKSTFVAHMSHEIRTPLNGILGFMELALEEEMSDKVRNYVQNAYDSALLLLEIANDIIDVSRIEAGALRIEKVDFNPALALESVIRILNLQAEKKNVVLKSKISSSFPLTLRGDQNRFKQILLNLGNNAVKFTSKGEVYLKIEGQPHREQPHLFVLRGTVKDTGIGIEPQFMKQLFEAFSQESRSTRHHFGGAGLGLYITKQLCEKMGGSINVISTPGLGSTFQFQILLESPVSSLLSLQKSFSSLSEVKLPISKVLVVDDNLMNLKVLKGVLNRLGCEVDVAEDGFKGLEAVQRKSYELVFMDGEMPHLDGLESTRKIREIFSPAQLPIIGFTAHAMMDHRQLFLEAGMNGYLTKPIRREDLINEILRCCGKDKD